MLGCLWGQTSAYILRIPDCVFLNSYDGHAFVGLWQDEMWHWGRVSGLIRLLVRLADAAIKACCEAALLLSNS
jgi:hypothetical protein